MARRLFLFVLILLLSTRPILGQWRSGGLPICTEPDAQDAAHIVADGAGGAIVIWRHYYWVGDVFYVEARAQRIDADGELVCALGDSWNDFAIASDGSGGAIVTWVKECDGDDDIYAQRIGSNGVMYWGADGVVVCDVTGGQGYPFNPTTTIRFNLPERSDVQLDIYDVNGAHVTQLASGVYDEGMHTIPWDGCAANGRPVSSGIYLCRLKAGADVLSQKMVLLR
jgi:hypothetical protein